MKYTRLGTTGLKVSPICFGCMSIGDPAPFADAFGLDLTPFTPATLAYVKNH